MLEQAVKQINEGEVVAFPTETVYGLGADARNRDAVAKVFRLKGRPADNPLIVHIAKEDQLHDFAAEVPEAALKLTRKFWPGPLTLVLPKKPEVLDIITGGLPTVAIRMPDHPMALDLISRTAPLVAPSANKSGRPSPTKAEHVKADFGDKVLILDGGPCKLGLESTVIRVDQNEITVLRPGHLEPRQIEEVAGIPVKTEKPGSTESPESPGMKYSHYAPNAEVRLRPDLPDRIKNDTLYLISRDIDMDVEEPENVILYAGNLKTLAVELYDRFRQADLEGYNYVEIIGLDESNQGGLEQALLNRIRKAGGIV